MTDKNPQFHKFIVSPHPKEVHNLTPRIPEKQKFVKLWNASFVIARSWIQNESLILHLFSKRQVT